MRRLDRCDHNVDILRSSATSRATGDQFRSRTYAMNREDINEPGARQFNPWACCMALLVLGIVWYGVYEMTIEYLNTSKGFAATGGMLIGGAVSVAAYETLRRWQHKVDSHK